MKKMRENNIRRARSMKRRILAGMVVLLFVMTVVVPVVNGQDVSEHSGKIYRNVLIFGIGHNQEEVDTQYRQPNGKWIVDGVEFDLVIAPYTGNLLGPV